MFTFEVDFILNHMKKIIFFSLASLILSCGGSGENSTELSEEINEFLPYLGQHDTEIVMEDGQKVQKTIYHTIPSYYLMAHDSSTFTNDRVAGKIHVANFFFTSCPHICPAMTAQINRLQEKTKDIKELTFLSHTIDPERDSITRLREYISEKKLNTENWFFLRGEKEYVHNLGLEGYMINALEDEEAEGGFLHSEHLVLIDREGHVRGLYNGTITEEVDQLNEDIRLLIKKEYGT